MAASVNSMNRRLIRLIPPASSDLDDDPGDYAVESAKDAEVHVAGLRIYRDIYYIATGTGNATSSWWRQRYFRQLKDPKSWNQRGNIFDRRNEVISK